MYNFWFLPKQLFYSQTENNSLHSTQRHVLKLEEKFILVGDASIQIELKNFFLNVIAPPKLVWLSAKLLLPSGISVVSKVVNSAIVSESLPTPDSLRESTFPKNYKNQNYLDKK